MESIQREDTIDIFLKCAYCSRLIYLSGGGATQPTEGVDGKIKYCSEECRDRDYHNDAQQKEVKLTPRFDLMTDDELETLLSQPAEVKALNLSSDNHLFFSIIQILANLDQTKRAVFQEGWKDFYDEKSSDLGVFSDSAEDFRKFFSAFNDYIVKLWHPNYQMVSSEGGVDSFSLNYIGNGQNYERNNVNDVLKFLSKYLMFLKPHSQKDTNSSGDSQEEETDKKDQTEASESDESTNEEESGHSHLSWLHFDLTQAKSSKRKST